MIFQEPAPPPEPEEPVETDEPTEEPDLTLKVRPEDLRKIVTGETGTKRLAFRGRLRAIGDIRLGMRLSEIFDLSS